MPAPKYTPEQIEKACAMRETGMSVNAIARALAMTRGAVDYHLRDKGVLSPNSRDPRPQPMTMKRGSHVVRRYTAEEDKTIVVMRKRGVKIKHIGDAIGRKPHSVSARLASLAARDARAEIRAGIDA